MVGSRFGFWGQNRGSVSSRFGFNGKTLKNHPFFVILFSKFWGWVRFLAGLVGLRFGFHFSGANCRFRRFVVQYFMVQHPTLSINKLLNKSWNISVAMATPLKSSLKIRGLLVTHRWRGVIHTCFCYQHLVTDCVDTYVPETQILVFG